MRVEDAPPAGWYPDPEGGSRLRWWEGTDWADRWRSPPTSLARSTVDESRARARDELERASTHVGSGLSRHDTEEIINQVRMAARSEAERAAQLFGQQARQATRELPELISGYTNKFFKIFRRLAVIAIVLLIAYVAFQLFAQASMFDWIGDRIDNLTDRINDGSDAGAAVVRLTG